MLYALWKVEYEDLYMQRRQHGHLWKHEHQRYRNFGDLYEIDQGNLIRLGHDRYQIQPVA